MVVKEPVSGHEIQVGPVTLDGVVVAQMIRLQAETELHANQIIVGGKGLAQGYLVLQ